MVVGIQGCAGDFVDDDGLCRPALERCAPGTIPKHDEGCVAVGLPGCAEEFMEDGVCRPSMTKCPQGTLALPQRGCLSIDGPDGCGAAPWGDLADAPGDVYVDPSYEGGDSTGSRERPFTTIAEAIQTVQGGGRVILAEGDYDEPVEITKQIELVGRCTSKVTIRGAQRHADGEESTIWIHDVEGAGVRGVSVVSSGVGLFVQGARASAQNLRVTGTHGSGVLVALAGAHLDLSHSFVQATRAEQDEDDVWTNVLVYDGASAKLVENALIDGNINLRVHSAEQEVIAEGNLLESLWAQAEANEDIGVFVDAGVLRLDASALLHHHTGALVTGAGAELVATRSLISAPPGGVPAATDVTAELGARATLEGSVLSGGCDAQLLVANDTTEVVARGNLFEGASAAEGATLRSAIEQRAGTLSLSSNVVSQAPDVGLLVTGGTVTATGLVVQGTGANPPSAGVFVKEANAKLTASYVSESRFAGVVLASDARLALVESLIERTGPAEPDGPGGVGLLSSEASAITVERAAVLESRVAGLLLADSPSTIKDTLIRGVERGTLLATGVEGQDGSAGSDFGDGILALKSTVEVSAANVEGCARAGLLFNDSDGTLASSRATGNRFGLVVQGAPSPTVEQNNTFTDNQESDKVLAGELPVPQVASVASIQR